MEYKEFLAISSDIAIWKAKLGQFCSRNDQVFDIKERLGPGKVEFFASVTKLLRKLVQELKEGDALIDWECLDNICNAMRISLRDSDGWIDCVSASLFDDLLFIVGYPANSNPSVAGVTCALRCLTNCMYVIPSTIVIFLDCGGLHKLHGIMENSKSTQASGGGSTAVLYFTTRLLFMLTTTREDIARSIKSPGWLSALVTTFTCSVLLPDSDGFMFPNGEKRGELFVEMVKLLHFLDIFSCLEHVEQVSATSVDADEVSGLEGQLFLSLLRVISGSDSSSISHQCRLVAFQLMMLVPDTESRAEQWASQPSTLDSAVVILYQQLMQAAESDGKMSDNAITASVAPILAVLITVARRNIFCRRHLHSTIFYSPTTSAVSGLSHTSHNPGASADSLGPTEPAAEGTLRHYLQVLMTSRDLTLKRLAAEFLFEVCGGDKDEFVAKTGLGNAIALLKGKGLM